MKFCLGLTALFIASVHATPVASDWATLNNTVDGRLFTGVPFARPCFQDANNTGGSFQPDLCAVIQENYMNKTFQRNIFGSYMNTGWETCQLTSAQCLLDWTDPGNPLATNPPQTCSQGSVPPFYVDVQNTNDIIAGFEFANRTGVTLVIKNTGHDFIGRSAAPGALALFMHNFKSITFDSAFKPAGSMNGETNPAVTIEAGVTFLDLYNFADAHNITVPGGADPTVGAAGGYLMGGGHSPLSNVFGLFVDRLLEVEVVTPTGQILTANDFQNTDLFFAIRGGGGGTFGVVTQATTLALPSMQLPTVRVIADILATDVDLQRKWMSLVIDKTIHFSQAGWGGNIYPHAGLLLTNPLLNDSAALADMQGIREFALNELNATFIHTFEPSYLSYFHNYIDPTQVPVGLPFATASRLIPVANFATAQSRAELVDAIITASNNELLPIILQTTPLLFGDKGGTSVTPAWRDSVWHVTASNVWNFNTTFDERVQIYAGLTHNMDGLRQITPGSGAYQNEADVYEPDFQQSFWGTNYDQLLSIKNKYDPNHILDCWHCVGWKGEQDPRYQCYIPVESV